ncbi:MAG: hypothetical protein R3D27_00550 [Hyphomicrobiaceae bacterium]
MTRALSWLLALLVSAGAIFSSDPAHAQRGRWVELGTQSVGFGVDRDTIRVGRDEGWLKAIRLSAQNNDVKLINVRIVYQNGFAETLNADTTLRAGGRPYLIDLRGERAFLKEVEMTYRARRGFAGRAQVKLEGQVIRGYDRPGGGRGRWVSLGRKQVGFIVDRDVVPVGRDEGWLRAIRLKAERNDVRLINVRVVYQNGFAENFGADTTLRPGGAPYEIDLRGERSFLKQIELIYRSRPSFKGQAVVEVEGQVVRPRR